MEGVDGRLWRHADRAHEQARLLLNDDLDQLIELSLGAGSQSVKSQLQRLASSQLQRLASARTERDEEYRGSLVVVCLPRGSPRGGLAPSSGRDQQIDSKRQIRRGEVLLDVLDLTTQVVGRVAWEGGPKGRGRSVRDVEPVALSRGERADIPSPPMTPSPPALDTAAASSGPA